MEAYLKESSEDEKLVTSVQWLFHQVNTDMSLIKNEALTSIRLVEDPRGRIMRAIQDYQSQKGSLQGRQAWAASAAATSILGSQVIHELAKALQPISKIASNQSLPRNVTVAAKNLVSHLHKLKTTYNEISDENQDSITKATNGTMVVPKRDLKAMMATVPDFSGEEDKEMASWLEFYTAVSRIKEVDLHNQSDVIALILTKIHSPAKNLILTQDINTSVTAIVT